MKEWLGAGFTMLLALALVIVVAPPSSGRAKDDASQTWPDLIPDPIPRVPPPEWMAGIDDLMKENNCAAVWDRLWPRAKNGDIKARAGLAAAVATMGLVPPGGNGDTFARFERLLIFSIYGSPAVYGLPGGTDAEKEFLRSLVSTKVLWGGRGREGGRGRDLLECLERGGAKSCLGVGARETRLVPRFEAYAREIEVIAGSRPGPAYCSFRRD